MEDPVHLFSSPGLTQWIAGLEKKSEEISIKNWMGPNPNGLLSKLVELLDTQVWGSIQ